MGVRSKTLFIIFLIGLLLIAGTVIFLYTLSTIETQPHYVFVNDATIQIEVVLAPELMQKGLSGRDLLPENSGMLFVYTEKNIPTFWMKEMRFPLDIIWINDNEVVAIEQNVSIDVPNESPRLYRPPVLINRVLEINAGFANAHYIKAGDKIRVQ